MDLNGDGYPMKQLPYVETTSGSPELGVRPQLPGDEVELARFGKKQQLKRNFGLLSTVGLTCTLMITWEGSLTVFQLGLTNGGPSGPIYGFLFAWIGTGLQALVMGELASMIPIAGGQNNWVAVLAPPAYTKFLSYLTGWITLIGWQAAQASAAFLGGTMIQGLLVLNHPSYAFQRWHGTLLFYAILGIALVVNTCLARLLPKVEIAMLLIHVVGFFCILIPLVHLGPHGSTRDVFANFLDNGGWNSDALSFFIGPSTSMFAFIGVDAASHMTEEIENASLVIPRSMLASVVLNGSLGFAMFTAMLFCLGSPEDALTTPTGFPFIEVFRNATGTNGGATAMTAEIIMALIFATISCLTTASRMTWAFAREKGLPASAVLAKVEPKTSLPLYCIGLSTVVSLLLALINIGSSTAFNALTSLTIVAFYSSFALSAMVLLHKRLTTSDSDMRYGPFNLGRAGIPTTIASLVYSVIGVFFSFWPATKDVTPVTMNWSVVVFSGVLFYSMLFWALWGRKVYTGPIIETTPGF